MKAMSTKNLVKFFCYIFLMSLTFSSHLLSSEKVSFFSDFQNNILGGNKKAVSLDFQDKIDDARDSFEDVYYDLVKNGHFGSDYPHNLVINTEIDRDFLQHGMTLLGLVEYLQQRDDFDSQFLLTKLNDFMCLNLHRFIAKMDAPKALQGSIWTSFYALYEHGIPLASTSTASALKSTSQEKYYYPFRTTLTKAIITMYLIFYSGLSHDQQKESLVYCLEKIKSELIKINWTLGEHYLDEFYLTDFVRVLETYALADLLVKPRNVKRLVLITLAVGTLIALAVVMVFKVAPNLPRSWQDFKNRVNELTREVGESFGKYFGDSIMNAAERKIAERQQVIYDQTGHLGGILATNASRVVEQKLTEKQETIQAEVKGFGTSIAQGVTNGMTPLVQQQTEQLRQQADRLRQQVDTLRQGLREETKELAAEAGKGLRNGLFGGLFG